MPNSRKRLLSLCQSAWRQKMRSEAEPAFHDLSVVSHRYLVGFVSCYVALIVRLGLDGVFPLAFSYVSFFPAIIVTAYFVG